LTVSGIFLLLFISLAITFTIPGYYTNQVLFILAYISIGWSILDFVVRLFAFPSLFVFFKSPINVIELGVLIVYILWLAMPQNSVILRLLSICASFKMTTFLRLFKYSASLRALKTTLLNGKLEIVSYLLYLSLGVFIFSSICYGFEASVPDTKFVSLPGKIYFKKISFFL
jgi:hypothetical protein